MFIFKLAKKLAYYAGCLRFYLYFHVFLIDYNMY